MTLKVTTSVYLLNMQTRLKSGHPKLGLTMNQVNQLNSTPDGQAQWNSMVTQAQDREAHAEDGFLGMPAGLQDALTLASAWYGGGALLADAPTAGASLGSGMTPSAGAGATFGTGGGSAFGIGGGITPGAATETFGGGVLGSGTAPGSSWELWSLIGWYPHHSRGPSCS
jgi:hypothetical protein